jgi:hypothetical protein
VGPDGAVETTVASDGTLVSGDVPPGAQGRRVVLAERADPRWRATFDGVPLTLEVADGWAAAFALPTTAGHLVVDHPVRVAAWAQWARAAVLLFALLMAVPVPRIRRRVGAPPRAALSVPRVAVDERDGAPARGAPLGSDEAAARWVRPDPEAEPAAPGAEPGAGAHPGTDADPLTGTDRGTAPDLPRQPVGVRAGRGAEGGS